MDENIDPRPSGSHAALPAAAASHLLANFMPYEPISRATSPGIPCSKSDEDDKKRYRPRTFAYFQQLPFQVEEEARRDAALQGILKQLYIAIKAEDFSPGALHWTRELQGWLNLKFEMTRELRAKLANLYYSLALAPGLDATAADRFLRMVLTLTRKNHYLKPGEDLTLDWRPLWNEIKAWVLPSEVPAHQSNRRRSTKQLLKLCTHAHIYFDPADRRDDAGRVLALLQPIQHPCMSTSRSQAISSLPSSTFGRFINRSKAFDVFFIDLFPRMARDHMHCSYVPFAAHGIFTKDQSDLIFTAILRLTQIPVGQASSPYTPLDYLSWAGGYVEKYPVAYMVARLIVSSFSPATLDEEDSTMSSLEGFMESIDTYFHPSNHGAWSTMLGQLTLYLTEAFVSRWNREQSGELDTPQERRINDDLKKRFVSSLKEVTFMGLFSKNATVSRHYCSALQGLAYLEPDLVVPGALQRFYPSLQGLSVAFSIPMVTLSKEAMHWVQGEMDRMERDGQNVKIDYKNELSDEDEANILRSSTTGLGEFILTLLGKVFTLLETLPDANQVRGGTPEDNVINALPAALSPLFASLSPELFDMALDKVASFVSSHVVYQARDAMGWILNAPCKANREKSLKVFIPMLVVNIRNEIDFNDAASDRSSGTDYLPRDRALVWYVSMLAMAVVHVGSEVLKYKEELLGIARYMQEKCCGLPTILISNFIHNLLLNLTHTYPIDHALYEPDVVKRGIDVDDWGKTTAPADLTIRWHQPSPAEIDFAVELFASQTSSAKEQLELLMSDNPPVSRKGKNMVWSDEISRLLQQIRLITSGMATMFDPERAVGVTNGVTTEEHDVGDDDEVMIDHKEDPLAEVAEDEELQPQFRYKAGYLLKSSDPAYGKIHDLRDELGHLLTKTHSFLNANQEDDVNCFTALYAAYRTWITDVGIERSANPLERQLGLYDADIFAFKINFGKPFERMIIVDDTVVTTIKPAEEVSTAIDSRHQFILQRRSRVEDSKANLGLELTRLAKGAHWKIATRCAIFATNLCLRFVGVAPAEFVDLVAHGTNDPHPGLRGYYLNSFTSVFTAIDMRAVYGHEHRNYLLEKEIGDRNRVAIPVEKGDAAFTQRFLQSFKQPDNAEYMVDSDHPGWLVWGKKFTAFRAKPLPFDAYDEVESAVREQIGKTVTREWFSNCFDYLKQEPRDSSTDRFRMSNVYLLMHVFDLMHYGKTAVTMEDVKELTTEVYGDGNDKHQHRATSEILGTLLAGSSDDPPDIRNRVWEFAAPFLLKIFADDLTPQNLQYWLTCLHLILDSKDPRRSHEIVDVLRSFRLDMTSNAAFKESSKVQLLEFIVADGGWHFQHETPILNDFLAHIDHPYKAVREAIGRVLSVIYKTRCHESFENVSKLLDENKADSSIGIQPYRPTQEFSSTIKEVFGRLEKWRHERPPGQQTPSVRLQDDVKVA
ncbi:hypothetical protein BKA56DRAFT_624244 [Ilyonectria sp. MPI-CAGE-AT-0026]|nr:hypothetical protein BKA56DRAFT_624244 [Ilyonectria sp. MPI-CAGE-AT-0026]